MKRRTIKDEIYGQFAFLAKAFASPKRIEIIDLLCQGEKTVERISEQAHIGIKNASAQLKELKTARLLISRREGKYIYYRLADPAVEKFWRSLRDFGHDRISDLQKITREALQSPEALEEMTRKELFEKVRHGDIILLDVRPADEFEAGHIPFALSVPLNELSKHLKTFPKKKTIVAYCRGPYCFFAKDAVETLKKKGFKALNLTDSVRDWASHGMSVETYGGRP